MLDATFYQNRMYTPVGKNSSYIICGSTNNPAERINTTIQLRVCGLDALVYGYNGWKDETGTYYGNSSWAMSENASSRSELVMHCGTD